MRRLVALVTVSMALTALVVPTAIAGGRRTAITDDCLGVDVRPRSIVFGCGDGGFFVRRLDWSMWRHFRARATGQFHMNDCDPSCAGGEIHTAFGHLRVRGRRWCPEIERYVFERAAIRYATPLLGRSETRFELFCPL